MVHPSRRAHHSPFQQSFRPKRQHQQHFHPSSIHEPQTFWLNVSSPLQRGLPRSLVLSENASLAMQPCKTGRTLGEAVHATQVRSGWGIESSTSIRSAESNHVQYSICAVLLLQRNVQHKTDVADLWSREILEYGDEIEKLVVMRVGEPAADRDCVLRVEDVRCRRVVDDDGFLEVSSDLGKILLAVSGC